MIDALHQKIESARTLLRLVAEDYAPAALSSSLGAEDMVLTDLVYTNALPIDVFTLDTGRLPAETYALLDAIAVRYGTRPRVWFPRTESVETYVNKHGIDAFYGSVELRQSCCRIRKVEPLRRALAGKRAWITGMRREQSVTRSELPVQSFDAEHGLTKFNPLADWSHREIWDFIRARQVPCHAMHDRGTRASAARRARARWRSARTSGRAAGGGENPESKECGLHVHTDGKPVREKEPA